MNEKVSVICTAYNHEKYIRDTLEGFINQNVDFDFEVLVHDDASTDNTATIIKEYEEKYPNIIRAIYQDENQYSKGKLITRDIILPLAKGQYIAFCEGDDYWCCNDKLKKQVDFLDKHKEYSACVHNTKYLYTDKRKNTIKYGRNECDLGPKDCMSYGGQSFHTSSVMVRSEIYKHMPDFVYSIDMVGDYPFAIYLSMCGPIRYLPHVMSVYRVATENSWTSAMTNEKRLLMYNQTIAMLESANAFSNGEYVLYLKSAVERHLLMKLYCEKKYNEVILFESNYLPKNEIVKYKIKAIILKYIPLLFKFYQTFVEYFRGLVR